MDNHDEAMAALAKVPPAQAVAYGLIRAALAYEAGLANQREHTEALLQVAMAIEGARKTVEAVEAVAPIPPARNGPYREYTFYATERGGQFSIRVEDNNRGTHRWTYRVMADSMPDAMGLANRETWAADALSVG